MILPHSTTGTSVVPHSYCRIKTSFVLIEYNCCVYQSYIVSLLPTWREFSFVISKNVNIFPELENIFKYHFPLSTLHGEWTDSESEKKFKQNQSNPIVNNDNDGSSWWMPRAWNFQSYSMKFLTFKTCLLFD